MTLSCHIENNADQQEKRRRHVIERAGFSLGGVRVYLAV
jgi:hypothetical protein